MPKAVDLDVRYVELGAIKPNPKNPRIHPESEINKLVKSIDGFGFTNPILVTQDMTIVSGHARMKAAQKLDLDQVPVIVLGLDNDEAMAYMVADNRIAKESQWDNAKLEDLMQEIYDSSVGLDMTAFDDPEIERILKDTLEQTEELIDEETDDEIPQVGLKVGAADMGYDMEEGSTGARGGVDGLDEDEPEPTFVIMIKFNDKDKANGFLNSIGLKEEMEGYTKQIDGNEL